MKGKYSSENHPNWKGGVSKDKEYLAKSKRLSNLKQYGITGEEYNQMYNDQNGKCAICEKPQIEFKRRFAVDHDHETGKVRGLLCNNMLGQAHDDPEILQNAIIYLGLN